MFDAARAQTIPGRHALMLDGEAGSFALSILPSNSTIELETVNQWAWSSNVRWSVAVNARTAVARVCRWDDPAKITAWPILSQRNASDLFDSFESSPQPTKETVIERGLHTFRSIRTAIEKHGGAELDVVLAFNTVLAWVAKKGKSAGKRDAGFAETVRRLGRDGAVGFSESDISPSLRDFPLGDLAELLIEGEAAQAEYLLDADLLMRHASGELYQEAHKQLLEPPRKDRQQQLPGAFFLVTGSERQHTKAPSYIHHTPPQLARALIEVALAHLQRKRGEPLDILDPACGSGVFLIESLREIPQLIESGTIHARGFDKSPVAFAMADFCLRHCVAGLKEEYSFSIQKRNSLSADGWGGPNLILMNPPFVSWEMQQPSERKFVRTSLGPAHSGRPDTANAFVFRALEALMPGGVMASVVPSSFLETESAEILRRHIATSGEYQIHLIGQFSFDYFDATVQPAFLVISRSEKRTPVRIVLADERHADTAIRLLRRLPSEKAEATPGCELYNIDQRSLAPERWTPIRQESIQLVNAIRNNTFTTVSDVFETYLGVRVGRKSVFMVSREELNRLCPTKREQSYFRPVADKIENGVIQPSGYVFYPYDEKGKLLLDTQESVKVVLPKFYAQRLRPAADYLKGRKSRYRKWWEVSRPVATWLAPRYPRIVAQEFGWAGKFAIDRTGDYAIVQGFGWVWKKGPPDEQTLLAYLAILNSHFFERVLEAFCPRVRGGQFILRRSFVQRVPLPDLINSSLFGSLVSIGVQIANGGDIDLQRQEELAMHAFGLSPDGRPMPISVNEPKRVEQRFRELSKELEIATQLHASARFTISHPAYREIIDLGPEVIPILLREMRDDPGLWSDALHELTRADPVPEGATSLADAARAWVAWGREQGHDV
ncbi:MAG: SAM-dependent DNA methyltransferase [Pirellulaceae bacterium]|nr:SAM-dependent DNA methyltransferase [Pirellulaceae bacterium]